MLSKYSTWLHHRTRNLVICYFYFNTPKKMRISFVDSGPDVYEYPSELSLLVDDVPSPVSPTVTSPLTGHTVPMLSGSSLANYTPKSTEDFQPGITRSFPNQPSPQPKPTSAEEIEQSLFEEVDQPITFSAGTNSDMLF
ncbi:hypothetical protein HHI36_012723 [Cryptolaemus montrouzieri]|uniref:Uncharacterized protein n=1 Tax=Cryptolaemus montrouzieri TaxID=559131 RepID=A0ABD2NFM9_9CUCU